MMTAGFCGSPSPVSHLPEPFPLRETLLTQTKGERKNIPAAPHHAGPGRQEGHSASPALQPSPDKGQSARNKEVHTAAGKGKSKPENTGTEPFNQHRPAASLQSTVYEAINHLNDSILEPTWSP